MIDLNDNNNGKAFVSRYFKQNSSLRIMKSKKQKLNKEKYIKNKLNESKCRDFHINGLNIV